MSKIYKKKIQKTDRYLWGAINVILKSVCVCVNRKYELACLCIYTRVSFDIFLLLLLATIHPDCI